MDADDDDNPPTSIARSWPDEDRTPTSERELNAFYSYSIAAEVFAVVAVGSFLPVTLEQLARENGVLYSDRNTPCISHTSTTARRLMRAASNNGTRDPDQCIIHLFGGDVTTTSFAMYTFSLAVLCQAIMLVSMSSFADYGSNRKLLLLTFGTIGALTSMSFMLVFPAVYLLASLLVVISVTCLGCSFVILNSYLPLLAANHPHVDDTSKERGHTRNASMESNSANAAELAISDFISSRAVGYGYTAALFVQLLSIAILFFTKKVFGNSASSTLPLRLILLLSGVWWLAFMIPTYLYLRPRPGPPLPTSQFSRLSGHATISTLVARLTFAWRGLWHTITIAVRLKQMTIFLVAWFILSDATASVSGTAILFARTELKIGTIGIALLSITAMMSGVLGAVFIPMISNRFGWSSSRTIIACLILMEVVPFYGLLAYLPFVRAWGVGGLQQAWEIYPLAVIHGAVMAGLSSYCRSLFGQLVPPGNEAAFFALFAITDKGSSAIGPAVVGRIIDLYGTIRPAFWFLAVLIALPMPLIWWVNADEGRDDARNMARKLKEGQSASIRLRNVNESAEAEGLMREVE